MDADMAAMFPDGIRALIVDDDTKFLKSATATLSVLNFEVVTCSTVAYALKSLTTGKLKGFDVVLAHAAKAAACGFDFRAIVEADLLIPVIYFLPPDHQAAGDEAEELLRTLEAAGSYIIQKPLDADEVRTRLWTVIAWRKCGLETKASGKRGAVDFEGEDEGRVHYKVVRARRPRKRKGGAGSSEPTVAAVFDRAGGGHPDKDNVANNNQQEPAQQKHGRGKKAQKNSGEAFKQLQQPDKGMVGGKQPRQWHPRLSSLFVESVLRTLNVPPDNPEFFSDYAGPSSNAAAAFAGASNAAAPPAPPPVYSAATAPSPAPPRLVYASAPPASPPAVRQQKQQQPAANNIVFGSMAPPVAASTAMPAAATATFEPQVSRGGTQTQQLEDVRRQLISGPFPHQQGPPPPVMQQDMVAPAAAGDGPSTGGMAAGASAAAATEAEAHGDEVSLPFLQPPNLVAGMVEVDMFTSMADPPVASQHDGDASDKVAMLSELLSKDFDDYSGGSSLAAPDAQILAMVSDLNGLIAGGASGSTGAASSVAPQDLGAAPNGGSSAASFMASNVSDLAMAGGGASGSSSSAAPFVAPRDLDAAPDGGSSSSKAPPFVAPDQDLSNACADQCEDRTSFPLDDLLGDLHSPMSEFDDAQLGASTGGAAAAAHDAAGTSRDGRGEEGGLMEAMFASDQHEDDSLFPIDAPLGDLHGPIFEFDDIDLDAQLAGGGAAHDAAGTSRNGGEEEGGLAEAMLASDQHEDGIIDALLGDLHGPIFEFDDIHLDAQLGGSTGGGSGEDVIDLNGIDIPFAVWTFEMEDFMSPRHKNKNNARE
ncbi:hypothetical protein PAHAL_2G048000 [Panicum hallii]|uniref:Response regulatory domain-containing protein n=1 Tax=Panicum hallii TaxID=206008 RepID=A0A2T8KMW2_9POAL|nr:hypothetical protein PAHAL_2G048000 [Panicum hallii]